jgi:hypothetical protein
VKVNKHPLRAVGKPESAAAVLLVTCAVPLLYSGVVVLPAPICSPYDTDSTVFYILVFSLYHADSNLSAALVISLCFFHGSVFDTLAVSAYTPCVPGGTVSDTPSDTLVFSPFAQQEKQKDCPLRSPAGVQSTVAVRPVMMWVPGVPRLRARASPSIKSGVDYHKNIVKSITYILWHIFPLR